MSDEDKTFGKFLVGLLVLSAGVVALAIYLERHL